MSEYRPDVRDLCYSGGGLEAAPSWARATFRRGTDQGRAGCSEADRPRNPAERPGAHRQRRRHRFGNGKGMDAGVACIGRRRHSQGALGVHHPPRPQPERKQRDRERQRDRDSSGSSHARAIGTPTVSVEGDPREPRYRRGGKMPPSTAPSWRSRALTPLGAAARVPRRMSCAARGAGRRPGEAATGNRAETIRRTAMSWVGRGSVRRR